MLRRQSTGSILRTIAILRICRNNAIVNNSDKLLSFGEKLLGRRAFDWCMKKTLYGHFVAGEDLLSLHQVANRLAESSVNCMYYVHMESDENAAADSSNALYNVHEQNLDVLLEALGCAPPVSMLQVKMTGISNINMLMDVTQAMREENCLPSSDHAALLEAAADPGNLAYLPDYVARKHEKDILAIHRRLEELVKRADSRGAIVIVDAEQTYFQPAIQRIVMPLMLRWNVRSRAQPIVYTTVQGYLTDCKSVLDGCLQLCRASDRKFATKLVRGAYMKQERDRAQALGYSNPTCASYEATNASYNGMVEAMMDSVSAGDASLMVSTHNETSLTQARNLMAVNGIAAERGDQVCFAQIYGLGDHMTSDLAHSGYRVYKSVPSGPIAGVLGYLGRRAQEENAVLSRVTAESQQLWKELFRRFSFRRLGSTGSTVGP